MMRHQLLTKSPAGRDDSIDAPLSPLPSAPLQPRSRQEEIADILRGFRSTTVLRRDELIAEYVEIERSSCAGQIDQPPAGGRQKSDKGIAKAARELDIPGKTEEGRRKFVERALQVASIPDEAKTAAIEAGLADKRSALLNIRQAENLEQALSKVKEEKQKKETPRAGFDLAAHKETITAVEAAWKDSELRRVLQTAPGSVRGWFSKRLLTEGEV
jgi:hypothetical protein